MNNYIYLIAGIIILIVVLYDFFYTTLSGSGASFLSKGCALVTHKFILGLEKIFGRKVLDISGMVVNLLVLTMWVLLVWLGLFLVFSYHPEAIIDQQKNSATWVERLYFTGYILSTLGIGDFKPATPFFEILSSLFSFFGFVFFTTAMAYLLSVSSAVIHKRSLSLMIRDLGVNPAEVVNRILKMDSSFSYQQIGSLQQMINQHSTYYQAYPVLHFYNNSDDAISFSINLAVLDEAMNIMLNSSRFKHLHQELQLLRNSIDKLLMHVMSRFGLEESDHPDISWRNLKIPEDVLDEAFSKELDLTERRKILTGLLHNANRSWEDVFLRP